MPRPEIDDLLRAVFFDLHESLERGTTGHCMAQLVRLSDQVSPHLGAMFRHLVREEWVEAAEKRLALCRFVDETTVQPMETWQQSFGAGTEHHGPLLAIVLGNLALRRLPALPLEALELVAAARAGAGAASLDEVDVEIRLLLEAVEAVALRVMEPEPRQAEDRFTHLVSKLGRLDATIHPELVADTWWLYSVDRRLAGAWATALEALRCALGWAESYGDHYRVAEYRLERGVVLELQGKAAQACVESSAAMATLREWPRMSLFERAVVQHAMHLVAAERFQAADRWLEEQVARLEGGVEPATILRLRGVVAMGFGRPAEAEVLLESAAEHAQADEDTAEACLIGIERLSLLVDRQRWPECRSVLASLQSTLMAAPQAPPDVLTSLESLLQEDDEMPRGLAPTVVRCLRARLREWQTRRCVSADLRVM